MPLLREKGEFMYQTYISYNLKDLQKILLEWKDKNRCEDPIYQILSDMVIYSTADFRINIGFGICGPDPFEEKYECVIICDEMNSIARFTKKESPLGMELIAKLSNLYNF